MKKSIPFLISIFLFVTILVSSCGKKGCTDSAALNYNDKAKKDDASCIYPSDKLAGSWNVAETVSNNTVNYTATISKTGNDQVTIYSTRTNPPVYHMNNLVVTVNWIQMKIEKPGSSVSGTITNENLFHIDYLYGVGGNVYSVVLEYTR